MFQCLLAFVHSSEPSWYLIPICLSPQKARIEKNFIRFFIYIKIINLIFIFQELGTCIYHKFCSGFSTFQAEITDM